MQVKISRRFGWLEANFLVLLVFALGLRLWELDGRTIHYDEAIHLYYAWRLSNLEEYIHSPWMHGPFQIEFTALILSLLGDTDLTARLGYVLFGTALVGLPYFLRDHLGRAGALAAGVMLAVSPSLLYFSRFGREDIIMAFWTTSLLVLAWRYIHEGRDRYLYLAAAVLACMFATKETAYFVVLVFGTLVGLLALPDFVPLVLRRERLSQLSGPAGFLFLLVTLTLPQWSAMSGLFQDFLGLTLVNPDGVERGLVGAPHWAEPFLLLPVFNAPWWFHVLAVAILLTVLVLSAVRKGLTLRSLLVGVAVPLLVTAGVLLAFFQPIGRTLISGAPSLLVNLPLAGAAGLAAIGILVLFQHSWRPSTLLVMLPSLAVLFYFTLFTPIVNVSALVNGLLPSGVQVNLAVNGVPVNFVAAAGILAIAFLVSIALGVGWRGGVWLGCAAVFYIIWLTLYTTIFTNWAGLFSGTWQGMGYWIAQQEVARGNQPWYYYLVGLSVYELLPVVFGVLGAVYFLRKGDVLGLVLAFWAGLTLLAYTIASEKMPWLLVNITLPFILLSGKYLGGLVERVPWHRVVRQGQVLLLATTPLVIVLGVYLVRTYVDVDASFSGMDWGILAGMTLTLILSAYLVRLARHQVGTALVGLGAAALLLVFGAWTAYRAAYTYDDSRPEFLVYAQGSADLKETYHRLEQEVFWAPAHKVPVRVDYEMWYPFQWYVRHEEREGNLRFSCFKVSDEEGATLGCSPVSNGPDAATLLLVAQHASRDDLVLTEYRKEGPFRNLLWFPESYRRLGENRQAEGLGEELAKDFAFFGEAATNRDTWRNVLDYIILRELERDWYYSEYYIYMP